jgi:cell division protein FtsQ
MNRQNQRKGNGSGFGQEERFSPERQPRTGTRQKNPALQHFLQTCILAVGGMIVLVGLLLLVLPMLRVRQIQVKGNQLYSTEQIIEIAGIETGEELLMVDKAQMTDNIFRACQYVDEVSIGKYFPGIVCITVKEKQNVMVTEFNGKYYTVDREFCVLEELGEGADLSGLLQVTLPQISSLAVGGTLHFENGETDLSYITELIDALDAWGVLPSVTYLDFSKKFSVSYVMQDTCRVELGKVSDMTAKLTMVDEILTRRGGVDADCAVVDVSNLQKPTYRVISAGDVLMK